MGKSISSAYCDGILVAKESLNLSATVGVPNAHNSVFASWNYIFAIRRNSAAENFIKMAFHTLSVKFDSSEKLFFLSLEVPYKTKQIRTKCL